MKTFRVLYMNIKGAVLPVGKIGEPHLNDYAKEILKNDGDKAIFIVISEAELQQRLKDEAKKTHSSEAGYLIDFIQEILGEKEA